MKRPRICAVITGKDIAAIKKVEPLADLFEVRIDLIGDGWPEVARQLKRPWIACNRRADEGGNWQKDETSRIGELLRAAELGAEMVDIELRTEGLAEAVALIKKRAKCLISYHDLKGTPPLDEMKATVQCQLDAGADVGKLIATARRPEDNMAVLELIPAFPQARVVAFAMGKTGLPSRILCPLVGGDFTYASIAAGRESAAGQMTVGDLRKLYQMVQNAE